MPNYFFKKSPFILAVFVLTAVFSFSSVQASFWDTIMARVTINPLEVNVSAPAEVEIDKVFKVEAKIINKGGEKIENAKTEIHFSSDGLTLLKKDPVQEIGVIPGKKTKKIAWPVKGEKLGYYFISVSASGELKGELISAESTAIKVSVVEKISPSRFEFLKEIFERWFRF